MLKGLSKFFTETLGLSAEIWLIISVCVVVAAFLAALLAGLLAGRFKTIKGVMKSVIANPSGTVAAMKKMPASVKTQYKNARIGNLKPSMLVTEQVCVSDPYKHSLISKVWLVTLIATFVSAALAEFGSMCANDEALVAGVIISPLTVWVFGGLLTLIGGIIGKCSYSGAVKTYEKFMPLMDGDQAGNAEAQAAAQQQPAYAAAEPQTAYAEPQTAYAEPQTAYAEPQTAYAEPQTTYAEPPVMEAQPVYTEAQPVVEAQQQESEEEIRRRAREEALAQARAQQQAQRQQQAAQAQAQQQAQAQAAAPAGHTSADDVIAQIEKIDRDGAPRETMREVATLLQKERAKPENKTPEQQKKLNEALSKLLKAMSAASRK